MDKVVFDIDGVVIDILSMILDIYNERFNENYKCKDIKEWDLSDLSRSKEEISDLFYDAYKTSEDKLKYYTGGVDLLKKHQKDDIFFITARDKEYNYYTRRSIDFVLKDNSLKIDYSLCNSKTKYDDFEDIYRECITYYEDSPYIFKRLYKINKKGFLVRHNYNKHLWSEFPTIDVCNEEDSCFNHSKEGYICTSNQMKGYLDGR
ncbi:MAG: hypothetical protein EF806_00430 [Candidatus Methanoliparum thermophilum]|uniref:HAD family hydrolase n=1 Tax=Methanoliparum thermophilum TaxID=2491083 RepID=A0A520KTK3_METT2|nr:hypothetical protein [Candidatus Methanoliparum sp. LAM-1]RZN65398.1 MAG: hypothetical protein EF806_00430 [Candidatus Methanoliparum thermophilum]BDC35513.1 hypothetical protein MTLP_01950 [Candidatus Methanoliparum sp. LAM-1]